MGSYNTERLGSFLDYFDLCEEKKGLNIFFHLPFNCSTLQMNTCPHGGVKFVTRSHNHTSFFDIMDAACPYLQRIGGMDQTCKMIISHIVLYDGVDYLLSS